MKKLLGIMAVALLAAVWTCQAVDYNNHFYNQRVYRVALGSGTAPAASDMALIGLHNGDMVLNTDDDCLYIMHATNVYTKMTSAGTVTLAAMSVPLASNKVFIGNSAGAANEKTLSGLFTITTGGVASATTTGSAVTGVVATAAVTPQAPGAVTPTITVTVQRPGAQTPTITVTPLAPATVTPTITVTAQRPGAVTPTITVTVQGTTGYDSTGAAITNAAGETLVWITNVTATCSALPDFVTNATATCSALPDFITNATAVSSALLDYPTNATAACSALPNFATNATAVITVTPTTTTFVKP